MRIILILLFLIPSLLQAEPRGGSGNANGEEIHGDVEIIESTNPQLTLTHTPSIDHTDFTVNSDGDLIIEPSSGRVGINQSNPESVLDVYLNEADRFAATIFNDQSNSGHGLLVSSDGTATGTYVLRAIGGATTEGFTIYGNGKMGFVDGTPSLRPSLALSTMSWFDRSAIGHAYISIIAQGGGRYSGIHFSDPDNEDQGGIRYYHFNDTLFLRSSATDQVAINSVGNLGINTFTPDRKLDVLDDTNPQLRLTHTDNTIYTDFQTDSNGDLTINPTGNQVFINSSYVAPTIDNEVATKKYVDDSISGVSAYAEIFVHDNASSQSIASGASYTKSTAWDTNGLSNNATADQANDKITFTQTGIYKVSLAVSARSGTSNINLLGSIFLNAVEQNQCHFRRKIATANDEGAMSLTCLVDVTTAPWDLDFRLRHDNGAAVNITITYANMNVLYIGAT